MHVDREALAHAVHRRYCLEKGCDKAPDKVDQSDRDMADNINETLALLP